MDFQFLTRADGTAVIFRDVWILLLGMMQNQIAKADIDPDRPDIPR